ncbi:MAG: exodeoxyribonuclease VII large subunit [Candidatus Omnitrophica bacterium]|nr:exodeoxyribonuclease VII large subunit [Candidatus Omnitrophota bacterium]
MTIFSVTDFIAHINDVLGRSWDAEELCVEGEVSGFRVSQGQWVNFDLKDETGLVNIFMTVWQLHVPVEDGMKVRVFGVPRIYPKFGKFSITANRIELVGEGALKKALAALKAKLELEGLFDPSRKRPLPVFPNRIALIASRESAAYGDFIRIVNERWRGLEIHTYHVKVQGMGAAEDIVQAIQAANTRSAIHRTAMSEDEYDAIVITRGGGSLEELMAFNSEVLVRAIHSSKVPTLVGIGHERDLSLAELAADVRGSTPTDCARRLVPDRNDVLRDLAHHTEKIENQLLQAINSKKDLIERALRSPALWLATERERLGQLASRAESNMQQWLKALSDKLRNHVRLLASLDPKGVLKRGYAILKSGSQTVTSIAGLSVGQPVTIVLRDGEGDARLEKLRRANEAKQQKLL